MTDQQLKEYCDAELISASSVAQGLIVMRIKCLRIDVS